MARQDHAEGHAARIVYALRVFLGTLIVEHTAPTTLDAELAHDAEEELHQSLEEALKEARHSAYADLLARIDEIDRKLEKTAALLTELVQGKAVN